MSAIGYPHPANVSPRRQNIIVFLNLFQFHGAAEARRVYIILARFAILPPGVICVRNLRNVIIIEDPIDAGSQLSKLASINEKRLAATVAPADSFVCIPSGTGIDTAIN